MSHVKCKFAVKILPTTPYICDEMLQQHDAVRPATPVTS